MTERYPVRSFNTQSVVFVLGTVVLLPVVLCAAALLVSSAGHPLTIAVIVGAIVAPLAIGLLVQLAVVAVVFRANRLEVGGGLYFQSIPVNRIDIESARLVSLAPGKFNVGTRINGIGMPGLRLGWFQPYKSKKLFVAASGSEALFVPTAEAYDILVGTERLELLFDHLRQLEGRPNDELSAP